MNGDLYFMIESLYYVIGRFYFMVDEFNTWLIISIIFHNRRMNHV